MCSGNKDTRSLRCILYLKNIHFDSLSRLEGLTLHLLILSKDCICLAKIYAYIMSYHTLYNAGNNLFLIAVILVKQNFSLFLTDFLKDYVLCILCCNTAKFVRVNRYLQDIANLCIGILLLCFYKRNLLSRIFYVFYNPAVCIYTEIACFSVNGNMYIVSFSKMILVCLDQGLLNGIQQSFLADIFLAFQFVQSTH